MWVLLRKTESRGFSDVPLPSAVRTRWERRALTFTIFLLFFMEFF
jgi:hypothetical protein